MPLCRVAAGPFGNTDQPTSYQPLRRQAHPDPGPDPAAPRLHAPSEPSRPSGHVKKSSAS